MTARPQHTPGPWRWGCDWTDEALGFGLDEMEGAKYADVALYGADGKQVIPLRVDHYAVEIDAPKAVGMIPEADRRLIAAAPDLLAACDLLVAEREVCQRTSDGAIAVVRAAIRKARGTV